MTNNDTIVAQATPIGKSSIGIIRVSGRQSSIIAKSLLGKIPEPRYASYLSFFDIKKNVIDKGIAIWFPKPNSFTGEDILEFQGHGGQVVLDLILKNILLLPGIRLAKPGEFSERAFLNKKIDLVQAESIIDLINASSEQGAIAAISSLQGKFSHIIKKLLSSVTNIRILIESNIDFPDEEINFITENKIKSKLKNILNIINIAITESTKVRKLYDGINIVLVGETNVGKSSLMNILTGENTSIVTNIPGTTRDIIQRKIDINQGISINISDTAGLRKTNNLIESIGIKLTFKEINKADHIIFIIDGSVYYVHQIKKIILNATKKIKKIKNIIFIYNKIDIVKIKAKITKVLNYDVIYLSSTTGEGVDLLLNYLENIIYNNDIKNTSENKLLARHRHIQALKKVKVHLLKSISYLSLKNIELLAEELKLSQHYLGEITGKFTSDNLLEKIFSKFCIGK